MVTIRIDGRILAEKLLNEIKNKVSDLSIAPTLAVIQTTNDPASKSYIRQKFKAAQKIGAQVKLISLGENCAENTLKQQINILNSDKNISGIIIQRPLPTQLKNSPVLFSIRDNKDVDGLNEKSKFTPPISLAVLKILEHIKNLRGGNHNYSASLRSKFILIVGVGETGGRPIQKTFDKMKIPHKTIDINTPEEKKLDLIKKSDIIISCVGFPNLITGEMIKEGAVCIGVGISRVGANHDSPAIMSLAGDFNEESIQDIASFYTPTPGGIGPLNVAFLISNLFTAATVSIS